MSRAGTINGPRLAMAREAVTGTLALGDLPRVADMGCDAATLRYAVSGSESADRRPALMVEVTGELRLICQRCLGAIEFPLAQTTVLELAATQAEIDGADDEHDRVLASKSMDVAALVEDEVILALPMIPMHASCETAVEQAGRGNGSPSTTRAGPQESGASPLDPGRKSNI